MNRQEVATYDQEASAVNPFGISVEAPLVQSEALRKHAPKTIYDGDVGTFGGRGGGD